MPVPEDLDKFESFVNIIARLRGPGGCPWDREQTHQSLRVSLMNEAYETLEALDTGDDAALCEELGDLMLQIVIHAQIAREAGAFGIEDVIRGIATKIIGRHPHVFGDATASTAGEVMANWEALKKREKPHRQSMLEGVPKAMPSLEYAFEIQRRVARVGFDWENVDGVVDKLAEEVREIRAARNGAELAEEYGDMLFTLANIIRRDGIDPETALREANEKFYRRFATMEKLCRERNRDLAEMSFCEQNELWEEAKKGTDREG